MVEDVWALVYGMLTAFGGGVMYLIVSRFTEKPADPEPEEPRRLGFEFDSGLWRVHPKDLDWITCGQCGQDDRGVKLEHGSVCLWCGELILLNRYLGLEVPPKKKIRRVP